MNMSSILHKTVLSTPDKMALTDDVKHVSYRELETRSEHFAKHLRSQGFEKGDRLVFAAPKSSSLIVGLFGCLKAGGTFVPVDHAVATGRLSYILDDIEPRCVVAPKGLIAQLSEAFEGRTRFIDEDEMEAMFVHAPDGIVLPEVQPDDVAYCIYTSGSSGRPKGVLIQHGSAMQFFESLSEVMLITSESRCMNTSPLYFDVCIMDIFFPLYCGASVFLSCGRITPGKLLSTIDSHQITHFTAVGPILTMMTRSAKFREYTLSSLVRLMTGGEILEVPTIQKWLQRVPGLSLVNGYGPTEATVICTYYIIDKIEPERTEFYPIGKPLKASECFLVEDGEVVTEPNRPGELYIAGPQVMKGYWRNEAQTTAHIKQINGMRCYASGDICKLLEDGNLYIIGRRDEEVKVSGFRIHLSEIRRAINTSQLVQESYVLVTQHAILGEVLVACVTKHDKQRNDAEIFAGLKARLKAELPYYMVPALWFLIGRFPKLPSQKTDTHQLARLVQQTLEEAEPHRTEFILMESEV